VAGILNPTYAVTTHSSVASSPSASLICNELPTESFKLHVPMRQQGPRAEI
jgi:hypothetical protein